MSIEKFIPFFGGLFQQPLMLRGAIRPLRPENKTLRRRFAPGEIASPREGTGIEGESGESGEGAVRLRDALKKKGAGFDSGINHKRLRLCDFDANFNSEKDFIITFLICW